MTKAAALPEAKEWLRPQTPDANREALKKRRHLIEDEPRCRASLSGQPAGLKSVDELDFSHPRDWAAFILISEAKLLRTTRNARTRNPRVIAAEVLAKK